MRGWLPLAALCGLAGCSSAPPACVADLCVGDAVAPAEPPKLKGYDLAGGLCGGLTVLPARDRLTGCDRDNAEAVIYRDGTHHYGLMLRAGVVVSIERTSRKAYP